MEYWERIGSEVRVQSAEELWVVAASRGEVTAQRRRLGDQRSDPLDSELVTSLQLDYEGDHTCFLLGLYTPETPVVYLLGACGSPHI